MLKLDDFKKYEIWCEDIALLLDGNQEAKEALRVDYPFDENLSENNHKVYDLILECKSADYFQYHQEGRINPVVPYFIQNFDDIQALLNDFCGLDELNDSIER